MKKEKKVLVIESLAAQLALTPNFYVVDLEGMNAQKTSMLRRECFTQNIKLVVVKNTLLRKAIENSQKNSEELYDVLKNNTSILLSNTGNVPAKLIKEFSKKYKKPVLKGAYVEECAYVGENQLDALVDVKSKEELIGGIIAMLQAPAQNVISALQSGGNTIHGVLKTLGEREA